MLRRVAGWTWVAALLVVLIWLPTLLIAFALVSAIAFRFDLLAFADDGEDSQETRGKACVLCLIGYGLLLFAAEYVLWSIFGDYQIPFRDAVFPTDETPLDLRFSFVGWLLIFMGVIDGISKLFHSTET